MSKCEIIKIIKTLLKEGPILWTLYIINLRNISIEKKSGEKRVEETTTQYNLWGARSSNLRAVHLFVSGMRFFK